VPTTNPLPVNVTQPLQVLYQEYLTSQKNGTPLVKSGAALFVLTNGNDVGIELHGNGTGSFNALLAAAQSDGLQVLATDATTQTVDGMLPITQLPAITQVPNLLSITPLTIPQQA
jgi:hypothetical protein